MKNAVRLLVAGAGLAMTASAVNAQAAAAPSSAQVWDVQFAVDSTGPLAAGPNATAVGITLRARVGIRANTSTAGTRNFGVGAIGGLTSTIAGTGGTTISSTNATQFLMTFVDPNGNTPNQGSVAQGFSSPQNDPAGNPLTGFFAPYRAGLSPSSVNTNVFNGVAGTNAAGNPIFGNISSTRNQTGGAGNPNIVAGDGVSAPVGDATDLNSFGDAYWPDGVEQNAANLVGDYVDIYRFVYFPKPDFSPNDGIPPDADRLITVSVRNLPVRYTFGVSVSNLSNTSGGGTGRQTILFSQAPLTFQFRVPTPGATALVGLAGLMAARRRRA